MLLFASCFLSFVFLWAFFASCFLSFVFYELFLDSRATFCELERRTLTWRCADWCSAISTAFRCPALCWSSPWQSSHNEKTFFGLHLHGIHMFSIATLKCLLMPYCHIHHPPSLKTKIQLTKIFTRQSTCLGHSVNKSTSPSWGLRYDGFKLLILKQSRLEMAKGYDPYNNNNGDR